MAAVKKTSQVKALFPDEVKSFLQDNAAGTYTLLDVRQPFEYEDAHLPGARLLPLPRLADSLDELDPGQPVLVYCATGGRSGMAARLLANQGFQEVYQIQGGINAWEDATASGPVAFHLRFVKGDEAPAEIIDIAWRMEEGLRQFHERIRGRTTDSDLKDLLTRLIRAEESHKDTLVKLLESLREGASKEGGTAPSPLTSQEGLIEGGIDITDFLRQNDRYLQSVAGYLDLAMMIETQALDLYLRMAGESANPTTKQVLFRIGEEEKAHLAMLGRYLETHARSGG